MLSPRSIRFPPRTTSKNRGADVFHRARQPGLRAAHQFQQHHGDQRRNPAPRNAPAGGRMAVEFGGGALQGATAAPALRRESRIREQAGGRAAPIWWMSTSTSRKGLPGQFGGGIGYSEAQKFSLNGNFVHSNFMGTGDRIALGDQCRQVQQELHLRAHRSLHHHRRRVAHDVLDAARYHAVRRGVLGVFDQADHRRGAMGVPDQRIPVPEPRHLGEQEQPGGLAGL